ncbi:MAG TPA: ABC transporter permease [Puia sp.]|nr:ABC transporter permease [Puia sp.]
MLLNFFKIARRNLLKNKVFSVVNIFGLAIGMAACWFIFEYIHFERSYDRWHVNAARIYRVPLAWAHYFSAHEAQADNYAGIGPAMKADFPEVKDFARIAPAGIFGGTTMLSYTDEQGNSKRFNETSFYFADASFLRMFSFPLVEGDAATALSDQHSVALSAGMARKYFGNRDPMGKTMYLNSNPMVVKGVFRDVPDNSHLHFDMLIGLPPKYGYTEFEAPAWYTYVLLAPGADPGRITAQLPAFVDKYLGKKMSSLNLSVSLALQPLTDIHLGASYGSEMEPQGSEKSLYFLTILGVFILVIAWINYVNLSTAKSLERAREVGVRKVAGATRWQLAGQFMLESMLVNGLALLVTVMIVAVTGHGFDIFVGKNVHRAFLASGLLGQWRFWAAVAGIFIIASVQVGAYPSLVISAFRPVLVLKGRFQRSAKGVFLRRALVTFQFFLSILLIAGTFLVYRQLQYMRSQDPGYNRDQLLIVKAPAELDSTYISRIKAFKSELSRDPAVRGVAPTTEIPGQRLEADNGIWRADHPKKDNDSYADFLGIDRDFIATYGVKLLAGSNIPENEDGNWARTKETRVLVNETLARQLGYASPAAALHQQIYFASWFGDIKAEIVGVVKDYQQQSLKTSYKPIMFYYGRHLRPGFFAVNVDTRDLPAALSYIKGLYNRFFAGNAYEAYFLNDHFAKQYGADQKLGDLFGLFAGLAIFVACMGLLGLSSYVIRLRVREIGIRKVLGAPVYSLLVLLCLDFIRLVGVAAAIALPVVWYSAVRWLQNYAFHIRVGWVVLVLPSLLLLVAALLTVGVQSVRAAMASPVKSLKTE